MRKRNVNKRKLAHELEAIGVIILGVVGIIYGICATPDAGNTVGLIMTIMKVAGRIGGIAIIIIGIGEFIDVRNRKYGKKEKNASINRRKHF